MTEACRKDVNSRARTAANSQHDRNNKTDTVYSSCAKN